LIVADHGHYRTRQATPYSGAKGTEDQVSSDLEVVRKIAGRHLSDDDRAGMTWGDCSALYWLSRRADMTADRLAPTSFTWQCF
jgi:hypothetical protein